MFTKRYYLSMCVLLVFLFSSCEKKESNGAPPEGTSKLELYLTDAPGSYKAVYLDIEEIKVRIDESNSTNADAGVWQKLPLIHSGTFNLLLLRNGNDTLLASGNVKTGTLREIYLKLGKKNEVLLNDGSTAPLMSPDSIHSDAMMILNKNDRTTPNGEQHQLVLDFDVSKSIIPTSDPTDSSRIIYMFLPHTRTFSKGAGGAIQGWVLPEAAHATVMAVSNNRDTLTTLPDQNGYFKLWGLPAGTYDLSYLPDQSTGYQSVTESNIQITSGQLVVKDTVRLHQ